MDATIVSEEIIAVLEKYKSSLEGVPGIKFKEFELPWDQKIRIALNPNDGVSPSILLSLIGLNDFGSKYTPAILCDTLYLLGTSGLGKTLLQLQYLSKHFGFYIIPGVVDFDDYEAKRHFGPRDFRPLLAQVNNMRTATANDDNASDSNLSTVRRYIKRLALVRFTILNYLLTNHPEVTAKDWIIYQLMNSEKTGNIFLDLDATIKNFTTEGLDTEFQKQKGILEVHMKRMKQPRVAFVFDEAQLLLNRGAGKFKSITTIGETRPLYSAIFSSVLHLFGDRTKSREFDFNTLFWAAGTGFSLVHSQKFDSSGVAVLVNPNVEVHVVNDILATADQVWNYMLCFLPVSILNTMDKSNPGIFNSLVGRHRFSTTMIERLLTSASGSGAIPEYEVIKDVVKTTKDMFICDLMESWNKIPSRLMNVCNPGTANTDVINTFAKFAMRLIKAWLFRGRPILLQKENKYLFDMFHAGVGILGSLHPYGRTEQFFWVKMLEPLTVLAGDKIYNASGSLMIADATNTLTSLGFKWEYCIAQALQNHAKREGKLNIATVFGISPTHLEGSGLENPLLLKNYNSARITSAGDWFDKGNDAAFVFPNCMAGPDLVWECETDKGDSVIFLAQAKFRDKVSFVEAYRSVTPSNLFKDKNGNVLAKNQETLQGVLEHIAKAKIVVQILLCYPCTSKNIAWKSHVVMPNKMKTRSCTSQNQTNVKILMDSRNALSLFGKKQLLMLKVAREEAQSFGIVDVDDWTDELEINDQGVEDDSSLSPKRKKV
jgi:hypothetical protein